MHWNRETPKTSGRIKTRYPALDALETPCAGKSALSHPGHAHMAVAYTIKALIQMLEKVAEKTNRARIITKASRPGAESI